MDDPETTQPGLTQAEDGTISIGQAASKFSQDKAAKEADENAQRVIDEINEQTERVDDPDYISGDGGSPGSLPGLDSDGRPIDSADKA